MVDILFIGSSSSNSTFKEKNQSYPSYQRKAISFLELTLILKTLKIIGEKLEI